MAIWGNPKPAKNGPAGDAGKPRFLALTLLARRRWFGEAMCLTKPCV
jgi:hypothetical protein